MVALKEYRRAQKIRIKDIALHPDTIRSIESDDGKASVNSLRTYLEAIGLQLTYSIK